MILFFIKTIYLCCLSFLLLSCATPYGDGRLDYKGRSNLLLAVTKPFAPKRVRQAYDNSVVKIYKARSDCQPVCPKVDIWQYQLKSKNGEIVVDKKPISSKREFWKNQHEARIIAISLFGEKKIYLDGLLDYFESFRHLKEVNHIQDPVWGFETFTIRLYVPKRRPERLTELGESKGILPDAYIDRFLNLGFEIAYVDNGRQDVGVDAFFWRFMVAAEEMPEGEQIRYLVRDADWKLTAGEAFAVGEWIDSGMAFHRMNMFGVCMTPVTGSMWGGLHKGSQSPFRDLHSQLEYYPYRLEYGDDELFIRDMIWPRMKYESSIMTHYYPRNWRSWFNPYVGSCEQPTQKYCDAIKLNGVCEDRLVPDDIAFPIVKLAMERASLAELKPYRHFFDMHLESPRGQRVKKALSAN